MPRRRKIEIKASEMPCFDTLVKELRSRTEFANLDPASVRIWAYEEYEPTLKNADKIIRRFDYWLGVHKEDVFITTHTGSRLFCKKDLAKFGDCPSDARQMDCKRVAEGLHHSDYVTWR